MAQLRMTGVGRGTEQLEWSCHLLGWKGLGSSRKVDWGEKGSGVGDTEFKTSVRHLTGDVTWAVAHGCGVQGRGPCQKHQTGRCQHRVS